jgi:hypothetical protein
LTNLILENRGQVIMNYTRFLLALLFGGVLVACTETEDRPEPVIPELPLYPSQIEILNTPLPIHETFNVSGPQGAIEFFNPTYSALATPDTHVDIADRFGNLYTLTDDLPSFYYPTCCFFETFPTNPDDPDFDPDFPGQQMRPPLVDPPVYVTDMDFRLKVADNKMAISNARFTIGQVLSDLTSDDEVNRKINTTDSAIAQLGSWGELDLTEPYRISFCLVARGVAGAGTSNLEVFVDNNSAGNQDHSVHVQASMLLRTATVGGPTPLVPGNRLVLDIPGQIRQFNNSGDQVGDALAVRPLLVGTPQSFLQLRVSSGGYAVISDLVVEYQSDRTVGQLVTDLPCTADSTFFTPPSPKEEREIENLPGTPYDPSIYTPPVILEVDATAGEAEFFAQLGGAIDAGTTTGNYLSISDDEFDNFYKEDGSAGRVFVDVANNAIHFGNALWTMGRKETDFIDSCNGSYTPPPPDPPCNTGTGATVNGDINLSQPYRITAQLTIVPPNPDARLQVQIDNNSGAGAASVHGAASRIMNLLASGGLTDGELVINVPGQITIDGNPVGTVADHIGTSTSFISFRCPQDGGDSCNPDTTATEGGIKLGNIVVENQ